MFNYTGQIGAVMESKISQTCYEITQLNIVGNMISNSWYQYIKSERINPETKEMETTNRPDFVAIAILADILYWYRLTEERNSAGETVGWRKKFKADKLQKSYQSYADLFDLPKSTIKRAFDNLEKLGLITREFRNLKVGNDKLPINNVMFVEPVPENIKIISYGVSPKNFEGCPKKFLGVENKNLSGTNTETTTEISSSVESKDSNSEFSKTENSRKTANTFDSNNSATNSVSETKANSLGQKSNAGTLRSMSKSPEVKQKMKGKPWIVPKANVPYWEIMKQYKFKVPQKPEAGIYKIVDSLITDLRKGEYFNSMPEYKSLANRKITPGDFKRFYDHFTLAAYSPSYWPVNPVTKRAYRGWYLDRMLMNNGHSAFATYLDNPPKSTTDTAKPLNDPTPHYTNFLINILKEKLEWDLDNGNRAKAIDAVTKLNSTFERLEPKIINYGYFCGDFYKRAKLLVEMFESHQDRGIPIRPEYINTDKTHSIFIPEYMERVGLIKS